jgi:hypothetical protein
LNTISKKAGGVINYSTYGEDRKQDEGAKMKQFFLATAALCIGLLVGFAAGEHLAQRRCSSEILKLRAENETNKVALDMATKEVQLDAAAIKQCADQLGRSNREMEQTIRRLQPKR